MNDPITAYLDELRGRLRSPERDRILAEAEDHLRTGTAAGLAAGLTEREAQEAAISAFGSVRAVVRAHHARRGRVLLDLVLAAWKLGSVGLLTVGASGLIALAMNKLVGRSFVGAAKAGTKFASSQCHYWMSIWPGARSCEQAAMLETSSDAVSLRVVAGIAGLVLMGGYFMARHVRRRRGADVLPSGFFSLVASGVFAAGAVGLTLVTVTGTPIGVQAGPGAYLSGALAALAVAVAYAIRLRRTMTTR